ncbi:acetyl-CoA C-acyltransferase [Leucobacter sp. UCMA 4100]|uniref:acetyl-CoA C-acyltransferase n=1 Tax=Leucobacter sp. UCMA 4100 TaxID=2810534 RepID=UPI0022EA5AB4|nr:acetyl-CoA C-acyltransferase [Leucobacter sp. UCMA 4100]MDA3147444.1 acetyl-CoA C-acyltransferase [Leucobacter sp. UCMA 4100]
MTALIAGYARTPFTRFNGQLASLKATELGAHAVRAALESAGVAAADVDTVVAGQVLQAGAGQNPARQTAVGAGISFDVPAMTINAVCLSGAEAVTQAARLVNAGEADVVVAVGQESMSLAPHVVGMRAGHRYGNATLIDTVEHDGLSDAFGRISMGQLTEEGNATHGLTREEQDALSARSHQLAEASAELTAGEIAPVTISSRRGDTVVSADDGIRPGTTAETLAALRPAFTPDGSVTAGNASQITDGAAAVIVVSEAASARLGLTPIAAIEAHALVAGPDTHLHSQPSRAIEAALGRVAGGASASDLAVVEINEAFAQVVLQSTRDLGIAPEIVNPRGGAIALGHPIGASGARIVGSLARQLADLGPGKLGAIGICGGGGQGTALVLRSL